MGYAVTWSIVLWNNHLSDNFLWDNLLWGNFPLDNILWYTSTYSNNSLHTHHTPIANLFTHVGVLG